MVMSKKQSFLTTKKCAVPSVAKSQPGQCSFKVLTACASAMNVCAKRSDMINDSFEPKWKRLNLPIPQMSLLSENLPTPHEIYNELQYVGGSEDAKRPCPSRGNHYRRTLRQ